MTINEVENILEILEKRHSNLDEAMLKTLLSAGGWEDKNIRDAVLVFRSKSYKHKIPNNMIVTPELTSLEDNSHLTNLPETVDNEHILLEHNPDTKTNEEKIIEEKKDERILQETSNTTEVDYPVVIPNEEISSEAKSEIKIKEKPSPEPKPEQSVSQEKYVSKEGEIPDNLPLLPFENKTHIWPFSLYKDLFQDGEIVKPEEKKLEIDYPKVSKPKRVISHESSIKEDKLIFLAEMMLLIILLILIYMYYNGRI